MARNFRNMGRRGWKALAVALAAWSWSDSAIAGDHSPDRVEGAGPLGYGAPGIYPGFQGFGLGYHLGYGYGGRALGTPDGGYPFYGGPGYLHPGPCLRRIGGINPFPHFGGPGFPTPDRPFFYGETGPLVVDQPVVSRDGGHNDPTVATSFGAFTGALPYSDAVFAGATSAASGTRLEMNPDGASPKVIPNADRRPGEPQNPSSWNDSPNDFIRQDRDLGFDQDLTVDPRLGRAMRVAKVDPGSPAAKSGLRKGDVIVSINDYTNTEPGNLPWILLHGAPDRVLRMKVRGGNAASERAITIPLDTNIAGGRASDELSVR